MMLRQFLHREPDHHQHHQRGYRDKNRGSHEGYSYITNTNGTVYKVMALNTVESETVDYKNEMKAYDIRVDNANLTSLDRNVVGWCGFLKDQSGQDVDFYNNTSPVNLPNIMTNSYGVWGGFEPKGSDAGCSPYPNCKTSAVKSTTDVICQ